MKAMKKYFEDYAVAQKACNEFNKKHWMGTIILSVFSGLATYALFAGIDKIGEKRRQRKIEKSEE